MADDRNRGKKGVKKTGSGSVRPRNASISRWNALKHGLLAKAVVIPAGDGQENSAEFESLLSTLQQDLAPVGALEAMLVEKIAVCYWRLRRVLRSEVGEIRKNLDFLNTELTFTRADDFAAQKLSLESLQAVLQAHRAASNPEDRLTQNTLSKLLTDLEPIRRSLYRSPQGVLFLAQQIKGAIQEVKRDGFLSDSTVTYLSEVFGGHLNPYLFSLSKLAKTTAAEAQPAGDPREQPSSGVADKHSGKGDRTAERATAAKLLEKLPPKEALLMALHEEEILLKVRGTITQMREKLEKETLLAQRTLPSPEDTDKILRYETTIERQLYRAIDELERLQRRRQGESVPPPVNVQLSGEK